MKMITIGRQPEFNDGSACRIPEQNYRICRQISTPLTILEAVKTYVFRLLVEDRDNSLSIYPNTPMTQTFSPQESPIKKSFQQVVCIKRRSQEGLTTGPFGVPPAPPVVPT